MSKIRKSVAGTFSGKLGNFVFKDRLAGPTVAMSPKPHKSTDLKAIARMTRFGTACRFGKAVNANPYLRKLWDWKTPNTMSPFNGIVKKNFPNIDVNLVKDTATLVPDIGFSLTYSTFEVDENQVRVTVNPIGDDTDIDTTVEKKIEMAAVLFLSSPIDPDFAPCQFLSLQSQSIDLSLTGDLSFTLPLNDIEKQYFARYLSQKTFAAAYTLDIEKKPHHFSNTLLK